MSAARAFLEPIRRRPNLTVATDTFASRVRFEGTRAVGVTTLARGELLAGEVLVCAGALQSPKLLQLSGVGPADHLARVGVPVVCASPGVGANLRDHWGLRLQFRLAGRQGHRGFRRVLNTLRYLASRTAR